MHQQFQDSNWDEVVALKEKVDKIYEGRLNWPMASKYSPVVCPFLEARPWSAALASLVMALTKTT